MYIKFLIFISDVQECANETDDCGENAECSNLVGGFSCSCLPGYSGDGKTCGGVYYWFLLCVITFEIRDSSQF